MSNYLIVILGGGLGAAARYWLTGIVHSRAGSIFPFGTLVVNGLGCFLIGFVMSSFEDRFLLQPSIRVFLTIGILGGFTTFSSFSFETISLLRDGEFLYASTNVFGSIFICLIGTWLGIQLGKMI
jgi:CrcB protein